MVHRSYGHDIQPDMLARATSPLRRTRTVSSLRGSSPMRAVRTRRCHMPHRATRDRSTRWRCGGRAPHLVQLLLREAAALEEAQGILARHGGPAGPGLLEPPREVLRGHREDGPSPGDLTQAVVMVWPEEQCADAKQCATSGAATQRRAPLPMAPFPLLVTDGGMGHELKMRGVSCGEKGACLPPSANPRQLAAVRRARHTLNRKLPTACPSAPAAWSSGSTRPTTTHSPRSGHCSQARASSVGAQDVR